jgi:ankyrin repeat protein
MATSNALHSAINQRDSGSHSRLIVFNPNLDLNRRDNLNRKTPLLKALEGGDGTTVKLFLDSLVDIEADFDNRLLMHWAVKRLMKSW